MQDIQYKNVSVWNVLYGVYKGREPNLAATLASQPAASHSLSFYNYYCFMTLRWGLLMGPAAESCGGIWLPRLNVSVCRLVSMAVGITRCGDSVLYDWAVINRVTLCQLVCVGRFTIIKLSPSLTYSFILLTIQLNSYWPKLFHFFFNSFFLFCLSVIYFSLHFLMLWILISSATLRHTK